MVRIPLKAIRDSGRNADHHSGGKPIRIGAKRRWHFDIARTDRNRQAESVRSEAKAGWSWRGCGERGGSPCPRFSTQWPRSADSAPASTEIYLTKTVQIRQFLTPRGFGELSSSPHNSLNQIARFGVVIVFVRLRKPFNGSGIGLFYATPFIKSGAEVKHCVLASRLRDVEMFLLDGLMKTSHRVLGVAPDTDTCIVPAPHFNQCVPIAAGDRTLIPESGATIVSPIRVYARYIVRGDRITLK